MHQALAEPLYSRPDPGPGWGAPERKQAWSNFSRGSVQWWKQTCQPLLRKSMTATRTEGWTFCGRSMQKAQLTLPWDLENALEMHSNLSAAEERKRHSRQKPGGDIIAGGHEAEKGPSGSNLFCRPGVFKFFSGHKTLASKKTKREAPFVKQTKRAIPVNGEGEHSIPGLRSLAPLWLPSTSTYWLSDLKQVI